MKKNSRITVRQPHSNPKRQFFPQRCAAIGRKCGRALGALLAVGVTLSALSASSGAADVAPPDTFSDAYVVMDAKTGQVLLGKNEDKTEFPASITKVLTVAMAMEQHQLSEKFVLTDAVNDIDPLSTHIALSPGEEVTVEQMAYAAMLESANDAANALAEYTGGTMDSFVAAMNQKVEQVGAKNTHFTNPNGLYNPQHYTTARDFALLTRWAVSVPGFRTVFGADEYDMSPTNKQPSPRHFGTYNCLTVESAYLYSGATGGKLGWTPESNHTISAIAHRGDMELIIVALNSQNKWSKFKDCVAIFDYCFNNFEQLVMKPADVGLPASVPLYEGENVLGDVVFADPGPVALDMPKGTPAASIRAQLRLPERYDAPPTEAPVLEYVDGSGVLVSVPLSFEVVKAAAAPLEEKKDSLPAALALFGRWCILLGIVIILLLIWRQIVVSRRRARRRALRAQRLGRAMPYPVDRPRRTAPPVTQHVRRRPRRDGQ